MTAQDGLRRGGDERPEARERLQSAEREERRLSDRYDAASSGSEELNARTDLREASDQVAAREAWVKWVERDD